MSNPNHILAIFAHPDDETFSCGGIFANLTDSGGRVTLICATRGEVGGISDPSLATRETLPQVREGELRRAMAHVGVSDVRFLDYWDSGMEGDAENADPRAFINAPEDVVAGRLAEFIREIDPAIVVTFGPDGIYGHPDHLMAHRTATAAVNLLGDNGPALYYNAISRERVKVMAKRPGSPFAQMTPEQLDQFGTPEDEITTLIDVAHQAERKIAALAEHATQFGANGPWAEMPRETVLELISVERFKLVSHGAHEPGTDPLAVVAAGALAGS